MLSYRPARDSDYDGIMELLKPYNMHHVPSAEMPKLYIEYCFVAEENGRLIGFSGWKPTEDGEAKTTLGCLDSEYQGKRISDKLLSLILVDAYECGCSYMITNADRPVAINWYKKRFGFKEIGKLKKLHDFGLSSVDEWTTLKIDLNDWYNNRIDK